MTSRLAAFWHDNWVTILVLLALAVGWLTLRTTPTPVPLDADLEAVVATGRPVVIEFYSNT